MMTSGLEKIKRPNIAELESLINSTEEGEIEILPSGDVIRLNVTELLQKNLRLEQERNAGLRSQIDELRSKLKEIEKIAARKEGEM
jgi:copper homeostasis protein CutC